MAEFVYPLDGTQNYTASQAGAFNGTRTSGVWSGDDNLEVAVTTSRKLIVSKGVAWFTTDDYWGKVYVSTADVEFSLPTADGILDRICRVVVRWSKVDNTAKLMLLNGELASSPVAPTAQKTDDVFDLVLADYKIIHGEVKGSSANLTDQRLNEQLCGLMRDGVTRIPTDTLYAQANALIAQLEQAIEDAGSGAIVDGAVTTAKIANKAVTEEKLADSFVHVIQSGTIGSWTYTKYSDGTMEAYASLALSGVNITDKDGSGFTNYSNPQSVDISALGFTEVGFCAVSGGTYGGGAWAAARSCNTNAALINVNSFRQLTNANVYIGVQIKGRWN